MVVWKNAVAIITGAGSGIGRALSIELARRGATVHVTDIDQGAAERVAREVGSGAHASRLDVRDAAAVRALVEGVARDHGKLDLMFNNAGIPVSGEASELSVEHWDRTIDVNLRGVIHGVAAAYPIMVRQGHGYIVNTASIAGLVPIALLASYTASKHAVVGLSGSLAAEGEAFGVKVSALCPGLIETPLIERDNPSDLPKIPWRPDTRRYLSKLAGDAYPAEKLAAEALAAMDRGETIIVIPRLARAAWRAYQLAPGLVAKVGAKLLAGERAHRPKG